MRLTVYQQLSFVEIHARTFIAINGTKGSIEFLASLAGLLSMNGWVQNRYHHVRRSLRVQAHRSVIDVLARDMPSIHLILAEHNI